MGSVGCEPHQKKAHVSCWTAGDIARLFALPLFCLREVPLSCWCGDLNQLLRIPTGKAPPKVQTKPQTRGKVYGKVTIGVVK